MGNKPVGTPIDDFIADGKFEQAERDLERTVSSVNSTVKNLSSQGYTVELGVEEDGTFKAAVSRKPADA